MTETPFEYERLFLREKAVKTEPEIRVPEVQNPIIPKNERNWFYTYHTAFLKTADSQAAYALGIFYRFREPCANWYPRAVEYFIQAAAGEPRAQWMLYELYRHGAENYPADPAKAFAALLASYEQTPAPNLSNLIARAYLRGEGVTADPLKARDYYVKGMLQNDETAQTELAALLRVLREHGEQAETRKIQRECMCELFRRCGVKFRDE